MRSGWAAAVAKKSPPGPVASWSKASMPKACVEIGDADGVGNGGGLRGTTTRELEADDGVCRRRRHRVLWRGKVISFAGDLAIGVDKGKALGLQTT